jgi:hypothetical protein
MELIHFSLLEFVCWGTDHIDRLDALKQMY